MKAPASPRVPGRPALAGRSEDQILETVDRQMRKACPWQRTGGVVDHRVVDVIVSDAGLGEGLGAGDAERTRGGEVLHLAEMPL
jgi:hypothetical protein